MKKEFYKFNVLSLQRFKLDILERKIKLIWDFRSVDALQIATNHNQDITVFTLKNRIKTYNVGFEMLSEYHSISFVVVDESNMIKLRDALKPQRAEVAK